MERQKDLFDDLGGAIVLPLGAYPVGATLSDTLAVASARLPGPRSRCSMRSVMIDGDCLPVKDDTRDGLEASRAIYTRMLRRYLTPERYDE